MDEKDRELEKRIEYLEENVIKDDIDVINLDQVVDNYFIKKAPTNVDVSYTVKARYSDGSDISEEEVRKAKAYLKNVTEGKRDLRS